jgi:hypothetical protein
MTDSPSSSALHTFARATLLAIVSCGLLHACGGGGGSTAASTDGGGGTSVTPPPSNPPGNGGGTGTTNTAPTISGAPATQVTAGTAYTFTPTANDAEGNTLTFSITNMPAWATFSTSNGRLTGTPSAAGSFANITISVSDGTNTASLAAFTVTVNAVATTPPPATGNATLAWMPPTTREDGSVLQNLAGYRIRTGSSAGNYSNTIDVTNPGLTTYVVENLAKGTWYFVVSAFDAAGVESALSSPVSKTIN